MQCHKVQRWDARIRSNCSVFREKCLSSSRSYHPLFQQDNKMITVSMILLLHNRLPLYNHITITQTRKYSIDCFRPTYPLFLLCSPTIYILIHHSNHIISNKVDNVKFTSTIHAKHSPLPRSSIVKYTPSFSSLLCLYIIESFAIFIIIIIIIIPIT